MVHAGRQQLLCHALRRRPLLLPSCFPLSPPLLPGCSISVPSASWANASLATVDPPSLTISASAWDAPHTLLVTPAPAHADGAYHITLQFE